MVPVTPHPAFMWVLESELGFLLLLQQALYPLGRARNPLRTLWRSSWPHPYVASTLSRLLFGLLLLFLNKVKIAFLFFLIIKTLPARTEEQCEEGSESDFASHVLGRTFFSTWVSIFADSLPCVYD